MVFIDRQHGVSVYGLHDDKGLGFRQLRRVRQIRELGFKFLAMKKYELAFYFTLLVACLFSVMTFAQILFFAFSLSAFLWLLSSTIVNPGQHFYYLKKDLKLAKRTGAKHQVSIFNSETVDASFGEELAATIMSDKHRPQKVFLALQGILMKLLVTKRRKRFMPFVASSEVKGTIVRSTAEDGINRFHFQHFLKHGKNHFAAIEVEKISGAIEHIFELKYIPKSSTIVLSVFLKETDSATSVACVDALSRELTLACEDEDEIVNAIKASYYKSCEFVRPILTQPQDFDFDALRAIPLETAQDYLPSLEDEVDTDKLPKVDETVPIPAKVDDLLKSELVETPETASQVVDTKASETKTEKISESGEQVQAPKAPEPMLKPANPYNFEVKPGMPASALKLFEQKMKMLLEMNNPKNGVWKFAETTKTGVSIYEDQKGDLVRVLSVFNVPLPFDDILPYARDATFRLKYDELLRNIEILKRYDEDLIVIRILVKGQFPVSDREFITYVFFTRLDENVRSAYTRQL